MPRPVLLVLSGPSGVGKDTLRARLKAKRLLLHFVITATTRPPRPEERHGVDYYFLSLEQFQQQKERGELLEWAEVYGHWYGVPRSEIEGALGRGQDVLVKVDIQGATTLKRLFPQAALLFVAPPSEQELKSRLRQRHTESFQELGLRLKRAEEEMKGLSSFDYVVVNNRLEEAIAQIEAIILAEKCRVSPRH